MAAVAGVHTRVAASWLHRLDARIKLLLLGAFSVVGLHLSGWVLLWLGLPLLAAAWMIGVLHRHRLNEMKWLGFMLSFIWIARAVSTEGTPLFSIATLSISREGLVDGMQVCLRLILVVLMGALFVATTRPGEVRAGVHWFLKPLPFVPAERIGTMIGLMVRFIPLIFEEAASTMDAQRARAVQNRRNPIYRMTVFGIPLLRRIFETADRLVLAMEARCYSESRTAAELRVGRRDWAALAAGFGWIALLVAV
jgi:energy-coupling factor transporter transmembrane protein EcfT